MDIRAHIKKIAYELDSFHDTLTENYGETQKMVQIKPALRI